MIIKSFVILAGRLGEASSKVAERAQKTRHFFSRSWPEGCDQSNALGRNVASRASIPKKHRQVEIHYIGRLSVQCSGLVVTDRAPARQSPGLHVYSHMPSFPYFLFCFPHGSPELSEFCELPSIQ